MKAVWVGRTTWLATQISLIVATFVKCLKHTLRRQITLHCWILYVSLTYANNMISLKLIRKSSSWPAWRAPKRSIKYDLIVS
jgi:hypothetical protein